MLVYRLCGSRARAGETVVDAEGPHGPVKIIYSIICRHDLGRIVDDVKRFNPHAFYTIEDVRFVAEKEGIFPTKFPWYKRKPLHPLNIIRKGK